MGYAAVLDALGDGTRRRILERLRTGPAPVGELAAGLPVSRPAVSRHLRVLQHAGLVDYDESGTRHLYRVNEEGLTELRTWLDGMWTDVLASFATYTAGRR